MQRQNGMIRFTAADLKVLKAVGFPSHEFPVLPRSVSGDLPLLWSPLSYVLASRHAQSSASHLWATYRYVRKLAAQRDRHYCRVRIPKADGGTRILDVPDYALRQEQEWICREVLERCHVSPFAFAYVKGRQMNTCAAVHAGHQTLIHLDIQNFFGSITEEMVTGALMSQTGYPREAARFLAALCCAHKRLPQGGLASPALSNIVFEPLDQLLHSCALECGCVYSRYADDIFFSGNPRAPELLIARAESLLRQFGFALNREKTRIIHQGRRMNVLGITVNSPQIQVNRQYRRKLRQEVHYLLQYGVGADGVAEHGGMLSYTQQLLGKVSYLLQIHPQDAWALQARDHLRQLLSQTQQIAATDPELAYRQKQLLFVLDRIQSQAARNLGIQAILKEELLFSPDVALRVSDPPGHWQWQQENARWTYEAFPFGSSLVIRSFCQWKLDPIRAHMAKAFLSRLDREICRPAHICLAEPGLCCHITVSSPTAPGAIALALRQLSVAQALLYAQMPDIIMPREKLFPQ